MSGLSTSRIPSAQSVLVTDLSSYPQSVKAEKHDDPDIEFNFRKNVLDQITSETTPTQFNELMR